jgi:hypothetical protein
MLEGIRGCEEIISNMYLLEGIRGQHKIPCRQIETFQNPIRK